MSKTVKNEIFGYFRIYIFRNSFQILHFSNFLFKTIGLELMSSSKLGIVFKEIAVWFIQFFGPVKNLLLSEDIYSLHESYTN
jgi:hypothetical protein